MEIIRKIFALSVVAVVLVFSGATGALATHRPGHEETPSCDPHPTSGGDQNKHCEPAPVETPPEQPDEPVTPQQEPPVVSSGGGGGGGGGGGDDVAEPPAAVPAELPFTGVELPEALAAAGLLTALGSVSLALGRRRAARSR